MAKILGRGIPTTATYAILGQEYIDQLTGKRYICVKSRTITSDKVGEADHYCEWAEESAGGGGIIGVTELPTEGIDEQSIYRVTKETEPVIWVAMNQSGTDIIVPYADFMAGSGSSVTIHTHLVDTLDNLIASDSANYHAHILESTGVAYVLINGNTMPLSAAVNGIDGGWVDSPDDMVVSEKTTMYCIRGESSITYHAYKAGTWTELSNSGATVVELELGTDGGSTGTITDEQIASMQNDFFNTVLRISANGSTVQFAPLADLGESGCKYSAINHTDSGFTLAVFTMDFSAKTYTYTNKDIT